MNERIRKFPKHRKIHIEMTDGEDTCNRMIRTEYLDVLYNLMNSQIKNTAMIRAAFGTHYSRAPLKKVALINKTRRTIFWRVFLHFF